MLSCVMVELLDLYPGKLQGVVKLVGLELAMATQVLKPTMATRVVTPVALEWAMATLLVKQVAVKLATETQVVILLG